MRDGPRRFTQNSSCSALLRIAARFASLSCTGLSPSPAVLSRTFHLAGILRPCRSFYPGLAETTPVWALPRSLATTCGITVVFSSCGYLDVSVPRVRPSCEVSGLPPDGLPHSDIPGSRVICTSPGLFAAYHVLLRLREPRHPPSALACFSFPWHFLLCRIDISSACSSRFLSLALHCQHVKDLSRRASPPPVENNGFEPLTPCLQSRCSSQLS